MCVHKYYRWRLCSVTKLPRSFIENPVYPLINQRITPSLHARFLSSLCSTTKQAFLCYYNPLCAAADKSLSCLCHPSPIFFHFFFFLLLLLLLLCIYIYILKFYLCLYLIWEKHFEGRVFDQQNTKQHWSATKNHQVPTEILKYLLKTFRSLHALFVLVIYMIYLFSFGYWKNLWVHTLYFFFFCG